MSTTVCTSAVPAGYWIAESAVSGGTFRQYLKTAMDAAQGRLCLRIAPTYMDFPLPCFDGAGTPLTRPELMRLHKDEPCYFSEALCTEYFSYLRDGQAHVVLFDSLDSLGKKAAVAQECGVPLLLVEDDALRAALFP